MFLNPNNITDRTPKEKKQVQKAGKLYIVATPIGNLDDITLRALKTLKNVDYILCEDPSVSVRLMQALGINTKCLRFNDHSSDQVIQKHINDINSGMHLALISDAGTPMISDPGFKLIKACFDNNLIVCPIPGASSVTALLCACPIPASTFYFGGFLPHKASEIINILKPLSNLATPLVFFDSARRIKDSLQKIQEVLGDRKVFIGREMTKLYESFYYGPISNISTQLPDELKGEIVLLIEQGTHEEMVEEELESLIQTIINPKSTKELASLISKLTGSPKNQIYDMIIRTKQA